MFTQKVFTCTLAGVAQLTECWPANQRHTSLTPGQGTYLGCGPCPQWRGRGWRRGRVACERQPHIDVSLQNYSLVAFY